MTRLVLLASITLPLALATTACSSSSGFQQPKTSAFAAGTCRDLAPAVLRLGKDLHDLGTKPPSTPVRNALKQQQQAVRDLQPNVEPALAPVVQDLVTAVGVLRLRTDTNSYDRSLAKTAMTRYTALVRACTTPGPTPS